MTHPSLGLPPPDRTAGDRVAAAAIGRGGARLRARAWEAAVELDPTLRDRHSELVQQALQADLDAFVDRLVTALATGDPRAMATFADLVAVRYRKRKVGMADVVTMCEGLRRASAAIVELESIEVLDASIDAAIAVFKWHRRLAGDARKRNTLLGFIYKGA